MAEAKRVLQTLALRAIEPKLAAYDFALCISNVRFTRRHDWYADIFLFTCLDGKPGLRIQPQVCLRVDRIEEIFHQTSGLSPADQKLSLTFGESIGELLSGSVTSNTFLVESESEISRTVVEIDQLFRDVALPYFGRYKTLYAIDEKLNQPEVSGFPNRGLFWLQCSKGLIVAKLIGRPDYDQLAKRYTDFITRSNKGFYLKFFLPLVESLKTIHQEA